MPNGPQHYITSFVHHSFGAFQFRPKCAKESATFRQYYATSLVYGSCRTVDKYNWRYCGQCDELCCQPSVSSTVTMNMQCESEEGTEGASKVELVERCSCEPCK